MLPSRCRHSRPTETAQTLTVVTKSESVVAVCGIRNRLRIATSRSTALRVGCYAARNDRGKVCSRIRCETDRFEIAASVSWRLRGVAAFSWLSQTVFASWRWRTASWAGRREPVGMRAPLPPGLRRRILDASRPLSASETSKRFGVGIRTVQRLRSEKIPVHWRLNSTAKV